VTDDATPRLAEAWRGSRWCPNAQSLASMPTRTNSNHATLITGVEPDVHGITGNTVWDRSAGRVRKLGAAADLLTETTFTIAHRAGRGLRSAAAVGKPKLGAMFAGDGGRQAPPDALWDAHTTSESAHDEVTGYAYDGTTLAAARALVEHAAADFVFINLSDVDRVSHGFGPQSPQAIETRRRTDAALATFLAWLAGRPDWTTTTVIVTADHGFDAITHPPIYFADALAAAHVDELAVAGDGGVCHVYATSQRTSRTSTTLAAARRVALALPGIADALYLRPNPADGGARHTLAVVHPDWHLEHERSGDLLLIAERGYHIVDGSKEEGKLVGNHGGPEDRAVPAIVLGGAPIRGEAGCEHVTAADLGRTAQACFALPEVQRLDGGRIDLTQRGRVLAGICPRPAAATSPALGQPPPS
jgi:hypothetical protein